MKRLLLGLLALAFSNLRAEVIYWMGDASKNQIDFVYAHVGVVKNGDMENVVYLEFPDGATSEYGTPLSGESILVDMDANGNVDYKTGASWADVSKYTSNEYGFFVEIVNYGKPNTDPSGEDRRYVAGVSDVWSYQDLVSAGHVYTDSLSMPNIQAAWAPTVMIPEPSGALLILLGLAALNLRRRRV